MKLNYCKVMIILFVSISIPYVRMAVAADGDFVSNSSNGTISEKRTIQGPQLNVGLDYCFFNYGQTVKGISAYLPKQPTYGVTVNMSFPVMDELYIRPGFTYYFGSSYDTIAGDTIQYSHSDLNLDIERPVGDWYYGAGINYPSWIMNPSAGATFDGMPGGQLFVGKYAGGWNYELGYKLVNGRINASGLSFEQFTDGFYIRVGYE
jgi:hypothetical protein